CRFRTAGQPGDISPPRHSTDSPPPDACGDRVSCRGSRAQGQARGALSVPVTRDGDGALALDGGGEPVEWAVEMVRFDEDGTLDPLAQRGELDEKLLAKLAVMVAAMHERAEPVEPTPWIAAVEQFIGNNTSIFRRHPEQFEDAAIIGLERQSLAAFGQLRPL